jgi:hypothetical protein
MGKVRKSTRKYTTVALGEKGKQVRVKENDKRVSLCDHCMGNCIVFYMSHCGNYNHDVCFECTDSECPTT